ATFHVTTTLDVVDSGDGLLSLREAVLEANSTAGPDVIDFAPGVSGTIALTGGQPSITGNLRIDGPGARPLALKRNTASPALATSGGTTVTITGLTITGGLAANGAGILNAGNLTLSNDVLSGDVAQGAALGGNAFGGGIYNDAGVVTIDQSVFTGNQAVAAD